jgi:predicted metal-dependent peptidase
MRHQTSTALRIQKARTTLLLDHPFFGSLLFRLRGQECHSIETMATDGKSLFYNPGFVDTLNSATLSGVLAHEVMHPALQHHLRRSGRDPKQWNEACDYAINPLLLADGLMLPEGALVADRFHGMSAEQIYNLLETESEQQPRNEGAQENNHGPASEPPASGTPDVLTAPVSDGGFGQVLDASNESEGAEPTQDHAREWEIAVNQAVTLAKQAGKSPAGLARTLDEASRAAVDWRELLRRLWSDTTPADYSWMRPNRRHLWTGLYLPGVVREGVGEIAIAVDCSGSVNQRLLGLFEAEVHSILEGQRPRRVHVMYFDAMVQRVDTYEAGESVVLRPVGGGGTEFGPCFEWLEEHGIRPETLVVLTDLCGGFPSSIPDYPVLWASTGRSQTPFGQVIPMHAA